MNDTISEARFLRRIKAVTSKLLEALSLYDLTLLYYCNNELVSIHKDVEHV